MLTPTFSQTETKNWFAAWMTPSANAATRTMTGVHADSAAQTTDNSAPTDSPDPEEWVTDCLFECYND